MAMGYTRKSSHRQREMICVCSSHRFLSLSPPPLPWALTTQMSQRLPVWCEQQTET